MDCFDMSIKVVFVSESHDTKSTFEAFLMGMGDHVSSEMRISFEGFTTIRLSTDKWSFILVFFTDMSDEMCIFVEGFPALRTCMISRGRFRHFRRGSLDEEELWLMLGIVWIWSVKYLMFNGINR